jgi:hypothetical protein
LCLNQGGDHGIGRQDAMRAKVGAKVLREPYRGGTFEKSATRPFAIVGCVMIASRRPMQGIPADIAV